MFCSIDALACTLVHERVQRYTSGAFPIFFCQETHHPLLPKKNTGKLNLMARGAETKFTGRFSINTYKTKWEKTLDTKKCASARKSTPQPKSEIPTFSTTLPSVPPASPQLEELLQKFPNRIDSHSRATKRRRQGAKRVLNGFIAFRTFYSQSISTVSEQREFSKALAAIWAVDADQVVWERFAQEYNFRARNENFKEWLINSTSLQPEFEVRANKKWGTSSNFHGTVEEVFDGSSNSGDPFDYLFARNIFLEQSEQSQGLDPLEFYSSDAELFPGL